MRRSPPAALAVLGLIAVLGCYDWAPGGGIGGGLDDDDATGDDDDTGADDDTGDDDDTGAGPCDEDPGIESIPINDECRVDLEITSDPDLQIVWQFSDFSPESCSREVMMTPLVVPLTDDDGDGVPSAGDARAVLFTTFCGNNYSDNGVLRALKGDGSDLLWSVTDSAWELQPDAALAAGDIDGDGWPEIIGVHEAGRLVAFDRFGNGLWQASVSVPAGTERGGAFVGDMDGDGTVEITYANQIYDPQGNLLAQGSYGTGSNAGRPEFPTSFLVDADLDGDQELITGNAAYDIDGNALWFNGQPDGFVAAANFDADPQAEFAVVFSNQVRIQDTDGTILFGPVTLPGSGSGGPPTVADFDGDGMPEIGVANLAYYSMLDGDLGLMWSNETTDESSSITGSSAFDFDGDGASEVVYSDEHDVWVWDGATGALIYQGAGHASGTHLEYPVVAQVLGEGPPQIVVGSNNLVGAGWNGITLLSDSGRAWVPTRPLWNQHAFMPTHIRDDLSIPADPDMPWLVGQGFRQNEVVTIPGVAASDLSLEIWAVCPEEDSVLLRLRPRNDGIPAGPFEVTLTREGESAAFASVDVVGLSGGTVGATLDFPVGLLDAAGPITAMIDAGDTVAECDEGNNGLVILPD